MKKKFIRSVIAVFLVSLCWGCKTQLLSQYTCLWTASENTTLASGGRGLGCGEVLLLYEVENDQILTTVEPDEQHTIYLPQDIGGNFPNHSFWNSFSEAELQQIKNENLLQRHYLPGPMMAKAYKLTLPVISLNNPGHAFVLTSFCTYSDEGLIIEHPVSGESALIQDIEYVKFKNAPLIQLPVGNEEGTGVMTG